MNILEEIKGRKKSVIAAIEKHKVEDREKLKERKYKII